MVSKRQAIDSLRQKLMERNADSVLSNQFLYTVLQEHAMWLIKREVSAGRIYRNVSLFQPLTIDMIEVPLVDSCLKIKTNCKIFRSKKKLPEMWTDNNGPVIKTVVSLDGSTDFFYTNPTTYQSKINDPYQRMGSIKYSYFDNGYLWTPVYNPHKLIVSGFFKDDLALYEDDCDECQKAKGCVRFLDTEFMVPDFILAELYSKALEQLANITKRLPEDQQIDKNTTRK